MVSPKVDYVKRKQEYSNISTISSNGDGWNGDYSVDEGTFLGLQLLNRECTNIEVLSSPERLHRLTVDVADLGIDQVLCSIVQSCPLRLTQLERERNGRIHVVAQVVVSGNTDRPLGSHNIKVGGFNVAYAHFQVQIQASPSKIDSHQWDIDRTPD